MRSWTRSSRNYIRRKAFSEVGAIVVIALIAAQSARAQTFSVLYTFRGSPSDGESPKGGLTLKGNILYGATSDGGPNFFGTIFKLDTAGNETILYEFNYLADDAALPQGDLTLDAHGNLYGSADYASGSLFKVGGPGNETTLYEFNQPNNPDGETPNSGLLLDANGSLYGSTKLGGAFHAGTIFRFDNNGVYTVLHNFSGADGTYPSGVIQDADGNIYGTASSGGVYGNGTIFKLGSSGLQTLYSFQTQSEPTSLIRDAQGNLYGAATSGGLTGCSGTCGFIFKLSATGVFTTMYTFTGGFDGGNPQSALIFGSAGDLYGTSTYGNGNVFKLVGGHLTVLHTFSAGADGWLPSGRLVRDPIGNLYGLATYGGVGSGVAFKITP